jgi:hypothetical protein
VRPVSRQALKALEERVVDAARTELRDQFVVVDCELLAVGGDGTLYVPGSDYLIVCVGRCGLDRLASYGRCRERRCWSNSRLR